MPWILGGTLKVPGAFLLFPLMRERYKRLKQPSKGLELVGSSKIH